MRRLPIMSLPPVQALSSAEIMDKITLTLNLAPINPHPNPNPNHSPNINPHPM